MRESDHSWVAVGINVDFGDCEASGFEVGDKTAWS